MEIDKSKYHNKLKDFSKNAFLEDKDYLRDIVMF